MLFVLTHSLPPLRRERAYCSSSASARLTKNRAKVLRRNLAGQPEHFCTSAEPLADDALLLGVVVVMDVLLLVIGFGLDRRDRSFGHDEHGLRSKSRRAWRPVRAQGRKLRN